MLKMIAKTLKKFGNSRCLPLDKTLLNILGVEFGDEKVIISIDNNRLIIEKASIPEEKTRFVLDDEQWEVFNKKLKLKPDLSNLSKLLTNKGLLDE
jgi:antitoxin component of MazEF toxin-antitoxin module